MHELRFDEKDISFLEKLPKQLRERIFSKIIASKEEPFRFFRSLEGKDFYKLRVGDYRVIADINKNAIEIVLIGHRKNIYKRFKK